MESESPVSPQLAPEPMDPQLTCIQPGGGAVMRLEMAWGAVRRAWLRIFRRGYVQRMESLRQGDFNPCPHDVLDPRDLKFHRNQGGWHWAPEHDPFRWRDQIPFARAGLAELILFSALTFGPAACLAAWLRTATLSTIAGTALWLVVATLTVIGGLIVWFFRDPERRIPEEPGLLLSPADGIISSIDEIEHDDFLDGPAVQIGIFLSIFHVHINRTPAACRVIGLSYRKGKYLNALRPESARENEQLAIRAQETASPYRRIIVRQIAGAIARRIVCWLKPGDLLGRGERIGMIKFGSRTELVFPREPGLTTQVKIGQGVKAGVTVLARYSAPGTGASEQP